MDDLKEETAIQVRVSPVPVIVEPREPLTAAPRMWVFPDLMTEDEVIVYLRIPHVSSGANFRYVIDNLIRMRGLPCIHICRKRLFPLEAVRQWIASQVGKGAA